MGPGGDSRPRFIMRGTDETTAEPARADALHAGDAGDPARSMARRKPVKCRACHGTGLKRFGYVLAECPACKGTGVR